MIFYLNKIVLIRGERRFVDNLEMFSPFYSAFPLIDENYILVINTFPCFNKGSYYHRMVLYHFIHVMNKKSVFADEHLA